MIKKWKGSAVVRALASHQCGPGSNPRRRHMWVEFVVLSLAPRSIILRVLGGFPLSLKTNSCKVQFDLERTDKSQRVLKNS